MLFYTMKIFFFFFSHISYTFIIFRSCKWTMYTENLSFRRMTIAIFGNIFFLLISFFCSRTRRSILYPGSLYISLSVPTSSPYKYK
uniref:Uncharacterized protein n=1 Tax=Cycas taitungensis TaxID=54799 RepID=A6H5K0_CYCTA|nr:hypothetical protein CYtaCp059 [Cycas taitungensis]BAF64966.1 hypothetical protein [Cycas taitungensis]